jgi:protein arginine kinase activator
LIKQLPLQKFIEFNRIRFLQRYPAREDMTERPVECSHCQKQTKVIYKEISQSTCLKTEMCKDCPILEEKLHGNAPRLSSCGSQEDSKLCCANCLTTLESIKKGSPLGCSNCYTVFGDSLIDSMIYDDKSLERTKVRPVHLGKSPLNPAVISPAEKLSSLNASLNNALKKENYEQAAKLRDQIKALSDPLK